MQHIGARKIHIGRLRSSTNRSTISAMMLNITFLLCCANMSEDSFTEFINNFTENDNVSMEKTGSDPHGRIWMPPNILGLTVIVSRCSAAVFGLSAILVNCLVFAATTKASPKILKSKTLIQNSILADIIWGFEACLPALFYMLTAYNALEAVKYISAINNHIGATIMYSQTLSALLLACDRLYAVLRPLTYHVVGYRNLAKVLLIASSWLGAVALTLPGIIIPFFNDKLDNSSFTVKLNYGHRYFNLDTRQYITIVVNVVIFVLYAAIFVVLDLQKRCNRALGTSTSDNRRTTLSLTLTYFLIHISSLCLYLPGPVFKQLRPSIPKSVMSKDAQAILTRNLFNLYLLNSVVNPLILGSRVRVIRQHLYAVIKQRRHQTNSKSEGTDATSGGS